jgi:hypothetical protein
MEGGIPAVSGLRHQRCKVLGRISPKGLMQRLLILALVIVRLNPTGAKFT